MKAVVISDVFGSRSGAHMATVLLCRALVGQGIRVTCFSTWVEPEHTVAEEEFAVVGPVVTRGYRWDWPNRCLALQATRHIKGNEPDLVLVVGVTRLARYLLNSSIAHCLLIWELTNGCGNKFVDVKACAALSRCKAMLSPSMTIDRSVRKHYRYEGDILRLPFWVEDQKFRFKSRRVKFLADFVYLGRRDEEKGLRELVQATAILARERPEVRVVIGGVGDAQPFSSLAKNLNVENNIDFASFPSRNDVIDALASARCLVLPSYHEGYPLVLLEAAQSGLPFIATDVGSIAEIFGESRACIVVKPRDSRSLAQAMMQMLSEPAEIHLERERSAFEMFQQLSSSERVAENLSNLLTQLNLVTDSTYK